MKTLQSVIEDAARSLHSAGVVCGHGTDNVRDEAAWLACHALGLSPVMPLPNQTLSRAQEELVQEWVERRISTRQPTAYLTGEAWFAGLPFYVNPDVLVPRSPLAELILEEFSPWVAAEQVRRVLDLCTGSGCIGITAALALPDAEVDLADISCAALSVAQRNIERHGLTGRVYCRHSDMFGALDDRRVDGQRYDLILSNPPYVPRAEAASLPLEYLAEPALGLASGEDGLDAACIILSEAVQYLSPGGQLILEVGGSWQRLEQALPELPLLWLEFSQGGDGVLIIRREELVEAAALLQNWREERGL